MGEEDAIFLAVTYPYAWRDEWGMATRKAQTPDHLFVVTGSFPYLYRNLSKSVVTERAGLDLAIDMVLSYELTESIPAHVDTVKKFLFFHNAHVFVPGVKKVIKPVSLSIGAYQVKWEERLASVHGTACWVVSKLTRIEGKDIYTLMEGLDND